MTTVGPSPFRRVRALRLRVPRSDLVRRSTILIEDALRVLTVPGGERNRIIFVRSLNLGRFSTKTSSAGVALALQRELERVQGQIVHGDDPRAPSSPVVFFNNSDEAITMLARRLARHQPVEGWFWPLAVPQWDRTESHSTALRGLLFTVARTEGAAAAVLALVDTLVQDGSLDVLLTELRPEDGPALLRAVVGEGTSWDAPPITLSDVVTAAQTPERWRQALTRWAAAWPVGDRRLVLLTLLALADRQPSRLADPTVLQLAQHVAGAVSLQHTRQNHRDLPETGQDLPASAGAASQREQGESPLPVGPPTRRSSLKARAQPDGSLPPESTHIVGGALDGPLQQRFDRAFEGSPPQAEVLLEAASSNDGPVDAGRSYGYSVPEGLQASGVAGLFYLVTVLQRLGFPAWLQQHPAAIAQDFCQKLFHHVALTHGAAGDDPVVRFLASDTRNDSAEPFPFSVPASWRNGIIEERAATLYRANGGPQRRVLFDSSGLLVLGTWHGVAPSVVRRLVERTGVVRGSNISVDSDIPLALDSWSAAVERWCIRFAGIPVAEVVRRPGSLLFTRTHLDVYFSLSQIDIRIRRAGMDINPGWVSWLGRVLSYWYTEDRYGGV